VSRSDPRVSPPAAAIVAERYRAAEQDRRRCRDATSVIERLAAGARRRGVPHPVAAAIARGVRIHGLATPEDLADLLGLSVESVVAAESGEVAFGDLPAPYGRVLAAIEVDVLGLAELARALGPPT
jgi:hypothetical protein